MPAKPPRTLLRARRAWGTATARTLAAVIDGCKRRRAGQARAAEHAGGHGTVDTDGEDVVDEGWGLRAEALILRMCEFSRATHSPSSASIFTSHASGA